MTPILFIAVAFHFICRSASMAAASSSAAAAVPLLAPASAVAAAPSAPSAIDAAYDTAATRAKRRKTGCMPEALLSAAVSKAIRDNLREMLPDEMDGIKDENGFTCRERLAERKQLNHECPSTYPCGKHFYNTLKDKYASAESPKKVVALAAAKVATQFFYIIVLDGVYTR